MSLGGSNYYDTSTGTYQNADASIKSSTSDVFYSMMNAASEVGTISSPAPTGVMPANSCLPGTMSGAIYTGGSGQCQALMNGQTTLITYCTGTETSGPCRPERINAVAAAQTAANLSKTTNQPCQAQIVGFPGVDTNTGLNYYYNISCGRSGSGGVSSSGSTGVSTSSSSLQSSSGSSSQTAYVNALLNIIRSMIATSKAAISQGAPGQNTTGITAVGTTNQNTPAANSTTCSVAGAQNSGIKNGAYRYTFTRNANGSWTVTLNNPAYSTPTDPYYVPANYSFTATDALDLNRQNQGRFNYLSTLPGTAAGNTEYDRLFGSFNNAYYDWDNMTKGLATPCTTSGQGSLTSQTLEQTSITFPATIMVNVNLLNARSTYSTQGTAIKQLAKGNTFVATSLVKGESVEGTDKWWVTSINNVSAYIWAGGTILSP